MDEIRADHFVGRPFEDALEISFAGFLHRGGNFRVAGVLRGLDREVHAGNRRRWHAERHAGELALYFGANERDSFGGASGGGDDVLRGSAATFPILLARAVHRFLRGGVSMDGGHQTFLDAETFLKQHVHERGKAVRGAGRVGNDVMFRAVIFLVVHAHDDRDVFILGGSGNDDLLRAGGDVAVGRSRIGLVSVGEEAGGFDDDVDAEGFPGQFSRSAGANDEDVLAVHHEHVIFRFVSGRLLGADRASKATLSGVVFDEVSEVVGGNDIPDRDDFNFFAHETLFDQRPENQAANTAEPIDCNFHCHNFDFSSGLRSKRAQMITGEGARSTRNLGVSNDWSTLMHPSEHLPKKHPLLTGAIRI